MRFAVPVMPRAEGERPSADQRFALLDVEYCAVTGRAHETLRNTGRISDLVAWVGEHGIDVVVCTSSSPRFAHALGERGVCVAWGPGLEVGDADALVVSLYEDPALQASLCGLLQETTGAWQFIGGRARAPGPEPGFEPDLDYYLSVSRSPLVRLRLAWRRWRSAAADQPATAS